jgi:YVTN family beta-propeller protein
VALALADNGRWLFTANERSGTISVVDTTNLKIAGETAVGKRLSDLTATPDGRNLLAVDSEANELIVLGRQGSDLKVVARTSVPIGPVKVRTAADGTRCYVASLWARRLTVIDLRPVVAASPDPATSPDPVVAASPHPATSPDRRSPVADGRPSVGAAARSGDRAATRGDRAATKGDQVAKLSTLSLPFAPRELLLIPNTDKLIVADAFGGKLAVVSTPESRIESVRELPAHNIRGLALSADGRYLLIGHQALHHHATTSRDDIHWGNLMTNLLRGIRVTDLLRADADLLAGGVSDQLGEATHGAGDPAAIAVTANNQVVIPLGGVNEVAVGEALRSPYHRLPVGARPAAALASPDGKRAFVANSFDDSVAVVDLHVPKVETTIALGTPVELKPADRGERLFYDARLSHDGWFSCHSCHTDGHTTGQLADTLGDGTYGTPKRILSLRGVGDTGPWAWTGNMPTLEAQIQKSVTTTMRGLPLSEEQVADLAAYLRTLPPPPRLPIADTSAIERGRAVFERHSCHTCHAPPTYTSAKTYDVNLPDEAGHRAFNPPSLRGLVHGGPYFHDNRASSLEEVFTRYRHQLTRELSPQELSDLAAFLRSL